MTPDPCVFCGGTDLDLSPHMLKHDISREVPGRWYAVHCDQCGAHGPKIPFDNESGDEDGALGMAIRLWNAGTRGANLMQAPLNDGSLLRAVRDFASAAISSGIRLPTAQLAGAYAAMIAAHDEAIDHLRLQKKGMP